MKFDDVFITGKVENKTNKQLCAIAIDGWVTCSLGEKPPENFGHGIVAIGEQLGITATLKNVEAYVEEQGYLK